MEAARRSQSFGSSEIKADSRRNGVSPLLLHAGMSGKTVTTGFWVGLLGVLMCASVFAASTPVPGATTVSVSLSGMSIVTKAGATPRVMAAATNLATVLQQITGVTFPITTNGNGTAGIAVGVKGDFPAVSYFQNPPFDGCGTNCTQREDYLLLAHTGADGVYVCGSTDAGVEYAVWDFLHRVGYRYYFPNAAWEMIPSQPTLTANFNVHESPDFIQRNIGAQCGSGWPNQSEGTTNYINWQKKNRNNSMVNANMFGQWGWASVMAAYPQEFNFSTHPDYFPMHNGVRTNSNLFCALNPAVLALCASYCTNYMTTHPGEDVVSMVPPDTGTGFCDDTCTYCGTNSLSDRMVLLANYCGVALRNAGYVNKRVGILVYSHYTSPPVNTIEPEVVPVACNGYASGAKAMSFGDLINQWNAKRKVAPNPAIGSTMGVYEYYSQVHWAADMPNKGLLASDYNFIADEIPSLYNRYKIRYMLMESEVNFGICGFGYYLATRLLWDTTTSPTAVRDEFFTNCFGTVACQNTMREFYDLISFANRDNVVTVFDTVGRMYKLLQTALTQTAGNQNVADRLNQLVVYTRYCELYNTFAQADPGVAKTNAMEALATHMYRMKDLDLVHTFAVWATCLDPLLPVGDNRGAYGAEGVNPWKVMTPFAANEYGAFITNGLAAHPPYPWTKRFSKDFVKSTPLNLPTVPTGYFCSNPGFSGDENLYTWIDPGSTSVTVYTKDVDVGQMMYLYSSVSSEANLEDRADVVHTAVWNVPATICEEDRVTLGTTKTGLHRLRRMANFTQITWVDGVPMTIPTYNLSLNWPDSNHVCATMYFYVPKGTTNIWFTSTGGGQCNGLMKDSSGALRYNLAWDATNEMNGIRSVAVPAGQDGKLWKLEDYGAVVHFFNIPPYIARSGAELLLPREVVEADVIPDYRMTITPTIHVGGTFLINWTAPAGHSSTDWISIVNTNGIGVVDGRSFYTGTTNTSGVITNWAPTTPGNYTVWYFLNGGYTDVTNIRSALAVTAWPGSITATPSPVAPDDDMTIDWTAPADHLYGDWIAVINSQGGVYEYCSLYTTNTSGSIEISAPPTEGIYTIRYFIGSSYEWVDSIQLTVAVAPTNYSMSLPSTKYAGGTFLINWTAPAGHSSTDWIAIVNTNGIGVVDGRSFYVGTTNTSGVITNWAPTTPGNYTVWYFLNGSYTDVTDIRSALAVTAWPGSITAMPSTVAPDDDMTIDWTAPAGHSSMDWIAVINSQGGVYEYCTLYTTNTSGSIELSAPPTEGIYTIRYFIGGNYEWVDSIQLTVQNPQNLAPTDSISTPANGATFTAPAAITINATASDSDGTVTKVEFYNGAAKMGEDTSSPYSLVTNNVATGSYALTVRATDDDGAVTTSTVANVTVVGLPSPWTAQNIGAVGLAGDTIYNSGTFTNKGAGTNIAGTVDAFRYVQQVTSGDCELKLRVASISNTSSRAKAGVMIRGSLTANAMEAGVWVTPSSGIVFTYRTSNGGSTTTSTSSGKVAPYWVRIARTSNSFKAYYSSNGTSWTQLGSTRTISMPSSAYMGMGTCSGNTNLLCISAMDNVTATP